jgi:hypothetical protein
VSQFPFFLVLIALLGAVGSWVKRNNHNKIVAKAKAVAAEAGLSIDVGPKEPPTSPFDVMERGTSKAVWFHMWPPSGGDSVFRYQYTTGTGKNRSTSRYTCALVPVPFNAPHLTIGPEGFWSSLGQMVGIRDVEIESAVFNDRYRVSCDDERFAITLLDHDMIAWLLSPSSGGGTVRFELVGNGLLCVSDELPFEQMPSLLAWASQVRQHLPEVLSELYPVRVA